MAAEDVAKAFNKLHATVASVVDDADDIFKQRRQQQKEEAVLRESAAPMTVQDAVPRILQAWKDKDYFRVLGLPPVEVDALGRPTTQCTDQDISRAYRKLSVFVHPDKPGNRDNPDAREAFERLNEARRILLDQGKRADELNKRLEDAKARKALADAQASFSERVAINAANSQAAKQHRQEEQHELKNALQSQVEQRRQAQLQKQQRRAKARPRPADSDDEAKPEPPSRGAADKKDSKAEDSEDDEVAKRLARVQKGKRRKR